MTHTLTLCGLTQPAEIGFHGILNGKPRAEKIDCSLRGDMDEAMELLDLAEPGQPCFIDDQFIVGTVEEIDHPRMTITMRYGNA